MKSKSREWDEWDQDRKLRKVVKGADKTGKHRKSIYNMLSDYEEEDLEYDSETGNVKHSYNGNFNYSKQR